MNRTTLLSFVVIFTITNATNLNSAFLRIDLPRAAGMGGAFVALSDDVSCCVYNPAGLPLLETREFSIGYSKLFLGLPEINISQYHITYTQPLQRKRSACGLHIYQLLEPTYKESIVSLSYGYLLIAVGKKQKLSLGISVKYLEINFITEDLQHFSISDPILASRSSKDTISLDLSFLYKMEKISMGLLVKNVNQPDISLSSQEMVPVPIEFNWGIAFSNLALFKKNNHIFPSIELSICRDKIFYFAGVELSFIDEQLNFRGGVNNKNNEFTFGVSYYLNFCRKGEVGCGIDYAILLPFGRESIQSTAGTHLISLNLKF